MVCNKLHLWWKYDVSPGVFSVILVSHLRDLPQEAQRKPIHYKIQLFPSFCPLKGTREQEKEQNSLLPACVFVLTIRFS